MSKPRGPNKANLEATRQAFIDIACEEFCAHGYADASTSRIVARSGMARGSLYYHFGDKRGLFHAVYVSFMDDGFKKVSKQMDKETNPWDALMVGSNAFLDLCMNEAFRKIILIESQTAITFKERIQILEKTLLGRLRQLLPVLLEKGHFQGHTEDTLAIFILGILGEAGRAFDFTSDISAARVTFGHAFEKTMQNLKA